MKIVVLICLLYLPFILKSEEIAPSTENASPTKVLPPPPSLTTPVSNISQSVFPSSSKEELKDIYPPVEIGKFWEESWFLISCGIFLILLLVWIIYKFFKKPAIIIPPDPFAEAMKELDSAKIFIQKNDQKNFAIKLSDAVRNYLDKDFKVPAVERTTEEFMSDAVKGLRFLNKDYLGELNNLLVNCDLAKFAKQTFLHRELEGWHSSAQKFVEYMHNEKIKQTSISSHK